MRTPRKLIVLVLLVLGLVAAACGGDDSSKASSGDTTAKTSSPVEVRLGYFPNITHAPAIVGVLGGYFEDALPKGDTLKTKTFNAGPEAVQALLAGSIDLSFLGPNPAINAYAQSDGAVRIVSGTTSGGAFLVVRDGIDQPSDLKGTKLATPQLGNTQDVALRAWLKDQGLSSTDTGGGDVSILPQANGDALNAFVAGSIDGAWVPEPFATRFVQEGKGHVLVDEATLWPEGKYVTTHLLVRKAFLEEHPDAVKAVIEGLADAIDLTKSDPAKAKALTNQGIAAVAGKPLSEAVLDGAWEHLSFTLDPVASSLKTSAEHAEEVDLLDPVDLKGIYDLKLLNEVLTARGEATVKGL